MKLKLAVAVVLAQAGVLAFMAGQREWVARTGRPISLRTIPVDPNDPMRGEYVRLNYEISQVPRSLCREGVSAWAGQWRPGSDFRDRRVYATLSVGPDGLAEITALSDREPAEGTYIRGRVDNPPFVQPAQGIRVRYGIEALFVEEGSAGRLADLRQGAKAGVPLDVDVAVGAGGLAVITGYHWEPLGLILTLDRPPRPARRAQPTGPRQGLAGATAVLRNASDKPVAVLASSLRLVANAQRGSGHYRWVGERPAPRHAVPDDVRVLKPGEVFQVHLDFAGPEWFVADTNKTGDEGQPVALASLATAFDASFRIEYAPASAAECAGLPGADLIWHGRLLSRAFSPAGGVD